MKTWAFEKDGTTLDCVSFGKGGKALVILPGLSFQRVKGAAVPLAYMYRAFSREYIVYVVDKKEAVPESYTLRDMASDTAFVMGELGLSGAAVFGVSQGGMIAQYLAINYPQLVGKLVLGVTASRTNPVMEEVVRRWVGWASRGEFEAVVRDMLGKMYSAAYVRKYGWLFPVLAKVGRPKDFGRFTALAKACLTCNAYLELHKISCPTFVIGGKLDQIVTGRASEEIAEALGCEIYMYDGLGHSAYDEAPDFNQRIYSFLTKE